MQQPNGMSPWQAWALEVQHTLQVQQSLIEKLTKELAELCEKVKTLEARPSYAIESIQYHFDQLKVEKLDGTLNIGMTAPGEGGQQIPGNGNGAIEQLAVPNAEVYPAADSSITPPTPAYEAIYAEINRYMDTDAQVKLQQLEAEYGIPLDPYHRRIIIEDVRKQMPARIQYYMQQQLKSSEKYGYKLSGNINEAQVIAKTERDADAAMQAYFQQLKANSESQGGKCN